MTTHPLGCFLSTPKNKITKFLYNTLITRDNIEVIMFYEVRLVAGMNGADQRQGDDLAITSVT